MFVVVLSDGLVKLDIEVEFVEFELCKNLIFPTLSSLELVFSTLNVFSIGLLLDDEHIKFIEKLIPVIVSELLLVQTMHNGLIFNGLLLNK